MTTEDNTSSQRPAPINSSDTDSSKVDALVKAILNLARKHMHNQRRPAGYFTEIKNKVSKITPRRNGN
jgi:hypothetical protein